MSIVRQSGHRAAVQALAISPDGEFIVSGDLTGSMIIWNVHTGKAIAEYNFDHEITAAAFHPVRANLVALSIIAQPLPSIFLFDLTTGRETQRWPESADELTFSPDGRYLAGKRYSVILVWDVVADELFVSVEGAYRPGIAFRDATTLVYRDGVSIRLLNLRNGSTVAELPSEDGTDFTIFSHGSRLLDLRANTAALWDLEQPRLIAESQSIPSGYDIVAAADGSVAFATSFTSFGDFPNLVMMLSGANLSTPTGVDGLTKPADALLFRDAVLYLGQRDGRIRRWQVDTERGLSVMPDLGLWSSPVRAIDISADKRLIALGDAEGVVDVFDVVSGVRRTYDPHNVRPEPPQPNYGTADTTGVSEIFRVRRTRVPELAVTALQFEQDGYALWISYDDGAVRVIEPITMAPIDETGPEEQVRGGFAISPDGRIMAVAGNRLVRWPNANTREWVFPLGETVERHDGFAIDPETGTVAIITSNGLHKSLRTFTAQGRPMAHKSVTASYCVLAMGGDTFLAPSGRDRFIAFNASSGHVVESHVIPFGFISEASCVSNGRRVAFGDSAGRLIVFDRDDGGWLARHQVHDTGLAITSLAWVGASDLLAVGSAGSVHFLDSETGDARSRLTNLGRSGWVFDSPSGRFDAPQANWSDIVFTHPNNRLTTVSNGQLLLARLTPGLLNRALKEPDDLVERLEPVKTTTIQAPRIAFLEPIPTIELSNGLSQPGTMLFHNGEVEREIPLITIRVPDSVVTAGPKIADAMSVRVRLLVEDAGSGIGDCRLLRNRQVVEFFSAPQGRPVAITHQTQVELGPGVSELSAFCFSSENVPGMTERITLATDDVAEHRGTAYVIAIGINDYRNSLLRLKYAGADADLFGRAVSTALEGTGRYSEVVRLVLRDSDVTKSMLSGVFDILAGQTSSDALAAVDSDVENIDRLQPVTVQDAVVVFFAGHGEMEGDTYRILLQDYDESADASSTLTDADFRDIFEGLNATQLILVIDACHAGGALSLRGGQLGPFNSTTFAQMAYDKGVFFLGAALDEQLALEERSFGHGLLTHVLVNEGLLTGKADRIPADDVITVREFLEYPLTGVPALHAELMRENVPLANSITNSPFRNFEIVGASTGVLQTPMAHFPAYGFNDDFLLANRNPK